MHYFLLVLQMCIMFFLDVSKISSSFFTMSNNFHDVEQFSRCQTIFTNDEEGYSQYRPNKYHKCKERSHTIWKTCTAFIGENVSNKVTMKWLNARWRWLVHDMILVYKQHYRWLTKVMCRRKMYANQDTSVFKITDSFIILYNILAVNFVFNNQQHFIWS